MRSEQTIFDELGNLCRSPGYVHALAYLCFRDNMISYSGEMKPEDMLHLFSRTRLIRTEIATLLGLMLKGQVDFGLPAPEVVEQYIKKTEELLEEIHHSMSAAIWGKWDPKETAKEGFNPFASGEALREPIFYGGESAYSFQYRDLSVRKYVRDDEWLVTNKGFSIKEARYVVYAIGRLQDDKSIATVKEMRGKHPTEWTILPAYTFTTAEVAAYAEVDIAKVERVLAVFVVPDGERNTQFNSLHDFNVANACPLIQVSDSTYLHLHAYMLDEALYESPFYWMNGCKAYVNTAMRHRGLFTEEFSAERLARVFGEGRVYSNVDIFDSSGDRAGEIDVLVIFGDRAIVLQAKSKRLTLEARKGNDGQIRDDFKKSVQDSCDQAYRCAALLGDTRFMLKDGASRVIPNPQSLKDVYVLCVVSDHYPALSFQARQFLRYQATDVISPPFVLDVFTLDAMTEMLDSPLRLLSYVDRRVKYADRLMASHELAILAYHLKRNLWLDGEHDLVMLEDAVSVDLDVAMTVRREGIPGKRTPDGILTRFADTTLGHIIKDIEARPDAATLALGYMLLMLDEDTVTQTSRAIDKLCKQALQDGKGHDVTIGAGDTGLTVHCNDDPVEVAAPSLRRHCHTRKYIQRAQTWFGLCLRPRDRKLRFGLSLDYKWECSDEMDAVTKDAAPPGKFADLLKMSGTRRTKIGRNDPCPCGSGKKYKKCCLP